VRRRSAKQGSFSRLRATTTSYCVATRTELYGSGQAWENLGDLERSVDRFERLAYRHADSELANEGLLRVLRLRLHLGDWELAAEAGAALRARQPDLMPLLRVASVSALALASLESGGLAEAQQLLGASERIINQEGWASAGRLPRDLAPHYFALGEAYRRRALAVELPRDPALFVGRLEERCVLLLQAQHAYADVMRAYDAHWSAVAGYRMAELYSTLHREVIELPPPAAAAPERAELFRAALAVRYAVLLRKALVVLDHTLAMARREGEHSPWIARAEAARSEAAAVLDAEQDRLQRLPYSPAELEAALERLRGPG
jgi:hypothetical protein